MINSPLCSKLSDIVFCPSCKSHYTIKNGTTGTGKQQYRCKNCGKYFIENYSYHAYDSDLNERIIILTKEGVGIRSTARILKISATTLLSRIIFIAKKIKQPTITTGKTYEVDEIRSFIGNKDHLIWIVYALDRQTRQVVCFNVGTRTNKTLNVVLQTLQNAQAKRIYTDRLKNYKYLIDKKVHKVSPFGTNHIERNNLTVRTHVKRLSRRTICFTRNVLLLFSVLRIYFWM